MTGDDSDLPELTTDGVGRKQQDDEEHREAWRITKENVLRWREQSTDPKFEPSPGYLKSVVFVLTEHLIGRKVEERK